MGGRWSVIDVPKRGSLLQPRDRENPMINSESAGPKGMSDMLVCLARIVDGWTVRVCSVAFDTLAQF
jgi:hypothetical protein